MHWYLLAVKQGHSGAMAGLGAMFAVGQGVEADSVNALMWTILAVAHGDKMDNGRPLHELLMEAMSPADINESNRLAIVCLESTYQICGRV